MDKDNPKYYAVEIREDGKPYWSVESDTEVFMTDIGTEEAALAIAALASLGHIMIFENAGVEEFQVFPLPCDEYFSTTSDDGPEDDTAAEEEELPMSMPKSKVGRSVA
jgi:hypothetical protein